MSFAKRGIPTVGNRWWKTENFKAASIPDLTGKTAVITGGTNGIGLESARQLALKNARVIILGSSEARGALAVEKIKQETGKTVEYVHINLSSIDSARKAAANIKSKCHGIQILLLCAGVAASFSLSEDGYENTFAINHIGHFAFVQPLISSLTGDDVRVVVVSSASHYNCKNIDFSTLKDTPPQDSVKFGDLYNEATRRYERSKLANVLFARALQRRVGPNVRVNTLHPGMIKTNIIEAIQPCLVCFGWLQPVVVATFQFVFTYIGMSIPDGALTQLYCCTSPEIKTKDHKGVYFAPIAVADRSSRVAEDVSLQEELWTWSEKAVAQI